MSLNMQTRSRAIPKAIHRTFMVLGFQMAKLCLGATEPQTGLTFKPWVGLKLKFLPSSRSSRVSLQNGVPKDLIKKMFNKMFDAGVDLPDYLIQARKHGMDNNDFIINLHRATHMKVIREIMKAVPKFTKFGSSFRLDQLQEYTNEPGYLNFRFEPVLKESWYETDHAFDKVIKGNRELVKDMRYLEKPKGFYQSAFVTETSQTKAFGMAAPSYPKAAPTRFRFDATKPAVEPTSEKPQRKRLTQLTLKQLTSPSPELIKQLQNVTFIVVESEGETYCCKHIFKERVQQKTAKKKKRKRFMLKEGEFDEPIYVPVPAELPDYGVELPDDAHVPADHDIFVVLES